MVQTFVNWLVNIISTLGYPGVALSVFLESFFAPIPSEIILPFSGFVAYSGVLNVYSVIAIATIFAYLGSLPFYFIGIWGEKYVTKFLDKFGKYLFIDNEDVKWAFNLFDKHGSKIVLIGRLIPIVRTLISLPAGVAKMHFGVFTAFTLIGSLVWNSVLVSAGYILGDNWGIVGEYINKYETAIIVICIALIFIYFLRNFLKKEKSK